MPRLADVGEKKLWWKTSAQFGTESDCRNRNREGEIVSLSSPRTHAKKAAGIIINAELISHTSIASAECAGVAVKNFQPSKCISEKTFTPARVFRHHSLRTGLLSQRLRGFGHRRLPARDIRPWQPRSAQGQKGLTHPPVIPKKIQASRSWRAA